MQVTIMQTNTIPAPAQRQESPEPSQLDFSNHLSQKIVESKANNDKKPADSQKAEKPSDDTEQSVPESIDIPITDAMLQFMEMLMNQTQPVSPEDATQTEEAPLLSIDTSSQIKPMPVNQVIVSPNTVIPAQEITEEKPQLEDGTSETSPIENSVPAAKPADDGFQVKPQDINIQDKPLVSVSADEPAQTQKVDSTVAQTVVQKNNADTDAPKNVQANETLTLKTTDANAKVVNVSSSQSNNADESFNDNKNETPSNTAAFELHANKNFVRISDSATNLDTPKVQTPQTQLVDTIKENLKAGKTEFEMQLTPVNLGKITVKMVAENGVLTVEIIADNPKTQSLLMSNASEIRDLIQGSVNPTTQVQTTNQSENLPQNYTQQDSKNQGQNSGEQNNGEQQGDKNQNQREQNEPATLDFLEVFKQLKAQSRMTFI